MPGGAIEFEESPEQALKREMLEETAMIASNCELLHIVTHQGTYTIEDKISKFHHIGILYRVASVKAITNVIAEVKCTMETFICNQSEHSYSFCSKGCRINGSPG